MDPVSLTLGVLPLLGAAISAYRAINEKIKICRHYSKEIRRLQVAFDGQKRIFVNEVHLLIRPIVNDGYTADRMLKDPTHPKWTSNVLDNAMRKALAENYDSCKDTITAIAEDIEELEESLEGFTEIIKYRKKDEPLRDTARRFRKAVQMSFTRPDLERIIGAFRSSNDDLRRLRKQSKELKTPITGTSGLIQSSKQLPQEYGEFRLIKKASRAFHAALQSLYSETSQSSRIIQLKHTVRLFLDAKVDHEVRMDVVISCYGHGMIQRGIMSSSLKKLQIRSRTIEWFDPALPTPPDSAASTESGAGRCKRRRVRFQDDYDDKDSREEEDSMAKLVPKTPPGIPLAASDICGSRSHARSPSPSGIADHLGDVDNFCQETFRHSFYLQNNPVLKATSMDQILDMPIERSLTMVEQLKTARIMIAAVLKFHSTPWLSEYFSLNDLCFFQSENDVFASLQTLHVGVDLVQEAAVADAEVDSSMTDVDQARTIQEPAGKALQKVLEEAKLLYGIRNMTLWSLGTTLLQIGLWSKIEAPDDVLAVRRLSAQMPKLGPKYQLLTKRCLECDFGYGDDLSKPRLQQAVYENIMCELTTMINSLEVDDD